MTVPPEMPRPNARSMLSFQRRVSFISGPVERRFLKSRSNGRLATYRHAPIPDPTRATSTVHTMAGRPRGIRCARPLPSCAGERPACAAARRERRERRRQHQEGGEPAEQDPDAADQAEVAKPAKIGGEQRGVRHRRRQRRGHGSAQAALHGRAQRRHRIDGLPPLLEVAREQDDAEVDAVPDDDGRQERRRQVQVTDAEAREGKRDHRAQRQRAQQRCDGGRRAEEQQHAQRHDHHREQGRPHHAAEQRVVLRGVGDDVAGDPETHRRARRPGGLRRPRAATAARTGALRDTSPEANGVRTTMICRRPSFETSGVGRSAPVLAASSCCFSSRSRSESDGPPPTAPPASSSTATNSGLSRAFRCASSSRIAVRSSVGINKWRCSQTNRSLAALS